MAFLLCPLLTGCISPPPDVADPYILDSVEEGRAVVGLVDSGINPYHEGFRDDLVRLPTDFIDSQTGERPRAVALSREGTFDERYSRDRPIWNSLEPGVLYWFEGTRVLGVSFARSASPAVLDTNESLFHGTGAASVVRRTHPAAWVVMAQIDFDFPDSEDTTLLNLEEKSTSVAWLSDQSWVDVISLSVGLEGNPPSPTWQVFADATRQAVERGKLIVTAATNVPTPTVGGSSGFPWVVSVGGVSSSTRGDQPQSGRMVDLVADDRWAVAGRSIDGYRNLSGTSFGTPVVAGVAARALSKVRVDVGEEGGSDGVLCVCLGKPITQRELRAALNASGVYWETTSFDPLNFTDPMTHIVQGPAVPIGPAPWLQMGWGYIGETAWQTVVAVLRDEPVSPKPPAAVAYMAQQQAMREAYWSSPP